MTREPLWNCPLCKGNGKVFWRLYSNISPQDWVCVGRAKPKPPKKKGKLLMAESALSKMQRAAWMEHFAHYEHRCPCTTMRKIDYSQLKFIAQQIQRTVENKNPRKHTLNDPLDDMFPGPYISPEFLK